MNVLTSWRRLVNSFNVRRPPAHDARIVAVMDAHGLSDLITLNVADFNRYTHISVITPQDWLLANPQVA